MIIDSPLLNRLALGTGRTIPQDGDSQVMVPPIITPTILSLFPQAALQAFTQPSETSFMVESIFQRSNQLAASQTVATVQRGYWHFHLVFNFRTNSTFTAITNDINNFVSFNNGLFVFALLRGWAQPNVLLSNMLLDFEALIPEQATFTHGVSATGATGTIESYVTLIGSRRL